MPEKKRIYYFDALRGLAIIGVVILHVSITAPTAFTEDHFLWWVTVSYKTIFSWAVLVFFMISGALLLSKQESISSIFTKRLPKLLIPFLFWNLVYAILDSIVNKDHTILFNLYRSLSGPIIYHFWFLYILIGLYIITPFLRVFLISAKRKDLEFFLLLSLITNSLIPFIEKFGNIEVGLHIPLVTGYVGYYMLGYYLNNYDISSSVKRLSYLLGLVSLPVILLSTYFLTSQTGQNNYFFLEPLSITVFFLTLAIFLLFKEMSFPKNNFIPRLASKIDINRVCFGIFFAHVAVLGILEGGKLGFKLNENITNPIFGVLINSFVILILCFSFFYTLELLKKNKYIAFISKLFY